MRPDAQLAPLLGLSATGGTLVDRYLLVNTAAGPGAGIVGADDPVPRHGRPLHAETMARRLLRRSTRMRRPRPRIPRSRPATSARPAARRLRSPTILHGRSSTHGRATRRGWARTATGGRPSAPMTCSTGMRPAIRNRTGLISTRSPSRKPTSSSGCLRTPSSRGTSTASAAALLVSPEGTQGGDRHDRRRPRRCAACSRASTSTSSRARPGCSVEDWECVRANRLSLCPSAASRMTLGGLLRRPRLRDGPAHRHRLR